MAMKKRVKEKFSRYDTADYLKNEADMVAYLEACMDEAGDDPAFIAVALGNIARAYGMVRLAKDTGLTREGLYKALSADGNPSLGTVLKVVKALGMKLTPEKARDGGTEPSFMRLAGTVRGVRNLSARKGFSRP
jgi:probable addiction module antidote protein